MQITDFYNYRKKTGRKISVITACDYFTGSLAQESAADCVLVGDSLAMVLYGHDSTLAATPEMMRRHTEAVRRAVKDKLLITDMPFLSFRQGADQAVRCAGGLLESGAQAVKLEGVRGHEDAVARIVGSGIPVMGHLGLTPQSVNAFGGYKMQGKDPAAARAIARDAKKLESLGAFALVLECVPETLAREITRRLTIPVIGIGAGPHTDGQVLVAHDVLGLCRGENPKFAKKYFDGFAAALSAVNSFDSEVKSGRFPGREHRYL